MAVRKHRDELLNQRCTFFPLFFRRIWAKGRDVEAGVKREDTGQTSIKSRALDGSAPDSRKSSRASRADKDAPKDQLLSQVSGASVLLVSGMLSGELARCIGSAGQDGEGCQ